MAFPSKTAPERTADSLIHAVSLIGFAIASVFLVRAAYVESSMAVFAAVLLYICWALFSVSISYAYHLLPRHDLRLVLRRWDHAAIYVVIAATFTPLLVKTGTANALGILAAIWLFAAIGVVFKMTAKEIAGRWSLKIGRAHV